MLDTNQAQLRVAILTTSDQTQQHANLLQEAGLNIVVLEAVGSVFLLQLEKSPADVLLVDLSEEVDSEIDIINTLLEYDSVPVFFNDSNPAGGNANALWAKKLARKLANMVRTHQPLTAAETPLEAMSGQGPQKPDLEPGTTNSFAQETSEPTSEPKSRPDDAASNIWVLGASLGGPQAVHQFLAAIKADLPVVFLLAQHIGANHIAVLAKQLNRVTPFKVIPGTSGYLLRHHEVVLVPADKHIGITEDGYLSLSPAPAGAIYSPSINNVITAVAERYGHKAGAIVFSGMGDDGASGCKAMADHGGVVWAQNIESCVISSMPDQARKTNSVTYSADPGCLAEKLHSYYSDTRT